VADKPTFKKIVESKFEELKKFFPHKKIPKIDPVIEPLEPLGPSTAELEEEKVEVVIKEAVLINPRDFSAFKHALEEFFTSWDGGEPPK